MKSYLLASLLLISGSAYAQSCGTGAVFSSQPALPEKAAWRASITQFNASGSFAKTDGNREKSMRSDMKEQTEVVLDATNPDTPEMLLYPAKGVTQEVTRELGEYGTQIFPEIKVSNLGPSGVLEATLLLPVSGHTGIANAKAWAKTDLYDISIEVGGQSRKIVDSAKSLDIITVQEVSIPLVKGQVVRLSYYRHGSAGPGGYPEGRLIDIVWDGT